MRRALRRARSKSGNGDGSVKGDDTKIAIVVTNKSLGPRQIDNQSTNGYSSQMQFTITKPSGESETHDETVPPTPARHAGPAVFARRAAQPGQDESGPAVRHDLRRRGAGNAGAADGWPQQRFSVKQSGPSLPLANFAAYQAISFDARGRSMTVITERGDSARSTRTIRSSACPATSRKSNEQ